MEEESQTLDPGAVTQLLQDMSEGSSDARERLFSLLYEELKTRAARAMRGQNPSHTLQATQLIGAAYERTSRLLGKDWKNREHFLAVAASAMRSVLVDHARRPKMKRQDSALERVVIETEHRVIDVLAFDEALQKLHELDPDMARAAEMRAFGIGRREILATLGIAERTFDRRWPSARAYLYQQIHGE